MNKVLNMTFESSLSKICELNSSFDTGVLKVCYCGKNRNGSNIPRSVLLECAKRTLKNVPVVCNYNREEDSIGGHDVEVARDGNGNLCLVNVTQPVGCVPESANVWFEEVHEDDGSVHEYLFVDVLLWKRQEAYKKIKRDGITAHSMEISVKDGETVDGVFNIYDFEFTALCLLGDACTPCFESSSLETFSKKELKDQIAEMMNDLKETFMISTPSGDEDKHPLEYSTEGGNAILEDNANLVGKDDLNENVENTSAVDGELNFTENAESESEQHDDNNEAENFELTNNIVGEIQRQLCEVTVQTKWEDNATRYWYVDCDMQLNEVYCWDINDWLLYGFAYTVDGDKITIDYATKKRMKYVIAEFNEGAQESPFAQTYEMLCEKLVEAREFEAKYNEMKSEKDEVFSEVESLRKFKEDVEAEKFSKDRENLFARFEDLVGNEDFEALRANEDLDLDSLEEKCFALRGRLNTHVKFEYEAKAPKIHVAHNMEDKHDLPYGGIVEELTGKR